jgi:hypothetical protein
MHGQEVAARRCRHVSNVRPHREAARRQCVHPSVDARATEGAHRRPTAGFTRCSVELNERV